MHGLNNDEKYVAGLQTMRKKRVRWESKIEILLAGWIFFLCSLSL